MKLTIRPVAKSERTTWEELFQAYAAFYKTSVTSQAFDNAWAWIFDKNKDFWCDVVENQDGKVIGFTQYSLMHRSLSGGMVVYLSDLFVEPNQRGSGAGRAMIDHVIEFARNRGISNVRWLTQEFNYTARQLYDTYQSKSDFVLYSVNT